jgi:hypothetical protein
MEREIAKDDELLMNGEPQRVINHDRTLGQSVTGENKTVDVRSHKAMMEVRLRNTRKALEPYGAIPSRDVGIPKAAAYAKALRDHTHAVPHELSEGEKGVALSQLLRDADLLEGFVRRASSFQSELVPWSFWVLFGVLAWLTFFGIAWPLGVLPGLTGSPTKAWMMGTLLVGLVVLLGFLVFQFLELRRLGKFHWMVEAKRDRAARKWYSWGPREKR